MAKTLNVFNKINSLRERYYKASIGKDALIKLIAEAEVAELVYNSNAIDKRAKERELILEVILLLHKMLISNIRDDIAGRFRSDNEYVRVGNHIAPNPKEITDRLEKMLAEYNATIHENIIKTIRY